MSTATRVCPSCNAEYIGWIERCSSCGVALVDVRPDGLDPFDVPEDQQVVYELIDWPVSHRDALADALRMNKIAHAWEGSDLVVHEDDEARVDELVDGVDPHIEIEEGGDEIVYDLSAWADDEREALGERLIGAGLAFTWEDDGSLVVPSSAEEQVEELMDDIEFPDALAAEDDDANDERAAEVLSELFLATDRLMRDPESAEGTDGLIAALDMSAVAGVPFGIDAGSWREVVDQCSAVRVMLANQDPDLAEIAGASAVVRQQLRQWV